jgi:hypothetical protein
VPKAAYEVPCGHLYWRDTAETEIIDHISWLLQNRDKFTCPGYEWKNFNAPKEVQLSGLKLVDVCVFSSKFATLSTLKQACDTLAEGIHLFIGSLPNYVSCQSQDGEGSHVRALMCQATFDGPVGTLPCDECERASVVIKQYSALASVPFLSMEVF